MSGRYKKTSSYRGGFRARTSGYRSAYKKRSYKSKSLVSKMKRVVRSLEETKWVGGYYAQTPSSTVTGATLINNIAIGSNRYNRTGDQFTMTGLELRTQIGPGAAVGPVATVVRDILVFDSQPNGAILIPAQIFADATQANWYLSPTDNNYVGLGKRYKVVMDRTTTLEVVVGTASPNVVQTTKSAVKFFKFGMNGQKIQLNDGSSQTITDFIKYSLYHISTTNQATAAGPFLNAEFKYKFKDA